MSKRANVLILFYFAAVTWNKGPNTEHSDPLWLQPCPSVTVKAPAFSLCPLKIRENTIYFPQLQKARPWRQVFLDLHKMFCVPFICILLLHAVLICNIINLQNSKKIKQSSQKKTCSTYTLPTLLGWGGG